MAILADDGYSAGEREEWLKRVVTHLTEEDGKDRSGNRAEMVAEIKDVLNNEVSGDPEADDTL